ncbi:MAG: type IX secretion system membrane protein PorP/SprF [Bacteroidota bacterium]
MKLIRLQILILLGLFCNTELSAQQKPQYTQYILNNYILNPALSGIENYVDIKISHRHQWVGLTDAPVTSYITIQGPIGKQDYNTNATTLFEVPGTNPRGKEYWENYSSSPAHHGVGLQIVDDKAGQFVSTSVFGTYAYHLPIGKRANLSAGIGIGASSIRLNTNNLLFEHNSQQVDPAVFGNGTTGKTKIDMNAGLWLYASNYFIGFSAMQLLPQRIDFSDDQTRKNAGKMAPHIFATAGYRFLLSEDFNVLPSVMFKSISPIPMQIDLNMKLAYKDKAWVGASYRNKYGFAGMAGFNAMNLFTLSYSYDYSVTQINTVSSGTHELILGFILGNKYNSDTCPKNVW